MKGRNVYFCLLFYLYFVSAFTHSKAQTITTGAVTPNSICAGTGGTVTVLFTTSGAFASSNTFSAQLSDASGVFPANPTVIGTIRTTSPLSGTISSTLAVGSNYRIRVVSSSRAVVGTTSTNALLVNPLPAAPAITTPLPYCEDDPNPALLMATPSAGGTLNWYGTNPNGPGNPSLARPNTSAAGSSMYYVSQTVNGCESKPRTPIPVSVRAKPAAPGVSPVNYCTGQTASALSATPSTGGTLNWYGTSPTSGTALPTGPIPTVNATYYVSQTVNGCESTRASLVVTFTPSPAAPLATAPGPYCEGTTAPSLTAAGQNLRWYGSVTGGTSSTLATVPSTTVVGTTIYYVSQMVNGCEGPRTAIPVLVKDTPDRPGTTAVSFCQGTQPPALTAALVANAAPNWYGTNAAGGSASGTAPALSSSTVGSTTYYVSQKLDGCESPRASLNVLVRLTPGAPGVSRTSFCNNRQAQPLSASGSNIKWFNAAGNELAGTPTPVTNTVGDQLFRASQTSSEGCEGPKADLVVTIKPLPGLPSVANLSFCQAQTDQPAQNVSALSANGQNLRWYNLNGDALSNAPTPAIDRTGVQNYQVSQTVNECEGDRATLQVTVRTTAAPAVTKPLVMYCINAQATPLQATIEPGASARWLDPYGRITNDAPTPSTLNTNVDPAGDRFFVYQIGSNGCYSPRSAIRVIVNTTPTLSLAAPISNVNLGLKVPLKLTFTGSAPYSYTITGGYTGTSLTNDTTITVLPRGNTTYQVNAVRNGCGIGLPGNPATAVVTVRIPTVATGAVTNSTLCVGMSLTVPFTTTGQFNPGNTFRYELVSLADSTKKYDIPATASASPVTAILPLTILSGQYFVRVKALNPEVGVTGTNSPTPVTIRSLPSAALTGSQAIYEGTPANLTIAFGGDGPWTVTYADSIRSYSAVTTVNPYVAEIRPARTTTYRITSVTNSCGTGPRSGTATVSVLPLLGVEDNSLDPLVTVYPIPTSTVLTVELDLPLLRDPAEISLLTMQGRSVLQHSTRSRRTDLDLSAQPNGLYILRIQVGDRYTVRKVIKL
ncbi:Ig-like domain-containing protein [Spirosoma arcticum]